MEAYNTNSIKELDNVTLKNFDEVIAELDKIVKWSASNRKRLGYFAALYKNITILVKHSAENGEFENKSQLEQLDVLFAQLYIDAFKKYRENELNTASPWYLTFQISEKKRLTIVQHLLLSINVHINHDLPIACARLGPNEKILSLCNDYFKLNTILSASIQGVEKGIFRLSPIISLLAMYIPKIERKLLNFSLSVARSKSWDCACRQAIATNYSDKEKIITESRAGCKKLSRRIIDPGFFARFITFFISLFEIHPIEKNIKVLDKNLLISKKNNGITEVKKT